MINVSMRARRQKHEKMKKKPTLLVALLQLLDIRKAMVQDLQKVRMQEEPFPSSPKGGKKKVTERRLLFFEFLKYAVYDEA